MEIETENKEEHQWKNSICSASSSRSSSITSDSSDGHFDIKHFPLPKPSLSASVAQKQRESHQEYNSVVSSCTGSSIPQNHLVDLPSYVPNRIPSSVFLSKPANSTAWSIASNESLFSIHDGNFGSLTKDDHPPRMEETVQEITETNPVLLPPTKKPNESEKETIAEEEPYQVGKLLDPEIADNEDVEEMTEPKRNNEEEEEIVEMDVLVEIEFENPEEKQVVENVKGDKPEDSNSIVSHSPSISCRSDTSSNSISSFAFPVLQKEDADIKTPSMEFKGNVCNKERLEYQQPQSPRPPSKPQPQPSSESSTLTQLQPQPPQRQASKQLESQPQSPKALKSGWFSCFHCPSKCGLFK